MDYQFTEEQEMTRQMVREFAEAEIRPHVLEWDETQTFPLETMRKLGQLGLLGIRFPEEYGGAAMSNVEYVMIIEELARVDGGLTLSVAAHNSLGSGHIFLAGNDEQKRKYLPALARGEKIAAWSLTEPHAGSDAGGTRTRAVKDGKHWVLNGQKTFTTHGTVGDVAVLFAVTDGSRGKNGISAFVVEKGTPGFSPGKKENKLGCRCSDTSTVILDDCRIPEENLLGGVNEGFKDALRILDGGRVGISALAVGMAQGAFEAARDYAKERQQFGKPIATFQAVQWMLADMATEIDAARLLTYRAAYLRDQGQNTTLESSQAKLFAGEMSVRVANKAVQVFGGYGYVKDFPVEKFYRDVKLCTIGEGTSEIQKLVIARHLVR